MSQDSPTPESQASPGHQELSEDELHAVIGGFGPLPPPPGQ